MATDCSRPHCYIPPYSASLYTMPTKLGDRDYTIQHSCSLRHTHSRHDCCISRLGEQKWNFELSRFVYGDLQLVECTCTFRGFVVVVCVCVCCRKKRKKRMECFGCVREAQCEIVWVANGELRKGERMVVRWLVVCVCVCVVIYFFGVNNFFNCLQTSSSSSTPTSILRTLLNNSYCSMTGTTSSMKVFNFFS